MKLTYNQFIISLLTIATACTVNNQLQVEISNFNNVVPTVAISRDITDFTISNSDASGDTNALKSRAFLTSDYDRVNAEAAREADLNRVHFTFEADAQFADEEETVDEISESEISDVETIEAESLETETVETTATETVVETAVETPVETPAPAPERVINYPAAGTWEYELFVLVNQARQDNGLQPYSYSGELAAAASVRAGEITTCFSHTRPDGSDFWSVNANIVYGENLAAGQTSAQQVFDEWMNSPSHRANILSSDYSTCGFAMVNNSDGVYNCYWVQEFGY